MFNVKTSQTSDLTTQTLPSQENSPLVLVTDDEEADRALLRTLMEQEGYRVVEACNGKQCLEAYTTCVPNIRLVRNINLGEKKMVVVFNLSYHHAKSNRLYS